MNDALIRQNLHSQILKRHHASRNTLVLDEFGLKHGECRADIAVINGKLVGYEIKSDEDTLDRLREQIRSYSAVFDEVWIVTGAKHAKAIYKRVPKWWGILVCTEDGHLFKFQKIRPAELNEFGNAYAVAQLLWHEEAASILKECGEPMSVLRKSRPVLYQRLCELLPEQLLRRRVIGCLKRRQKWRHPSLLCVNDG